MTTAQATQVVWNRPSHFIGSERCSWGRTTVVPGHIVSSVGEYEVDGEPREVGSNRMYETMVFNWGGARCVDADCGCGGLPKPTSWGNIDFLPANSREECEGNHAALVEKYGGGK